MLPDAPVPQPGIISGTVVDVNGDAVPGATVVLQGPSLKSARTIASNSNGFFEFNDVEPELPVTSLSPPGDLPAGLRPTLL